MRNLLSLLISVLVFDDLFVEYNNILKAYEILSNEKRILRNSICPNCNSRKRHRGLFILYKEI